MDHHQGEERTRRHRRCEEHRHQREDRRRRRHADRRTADPHRSEEGRRRHAFDQGREARRRGGTETEGVNRCAPERRTFFP
ncbi:Eukaryotic translation initiation factor 3 110 kDa subunit [Burkholderia vietnamiensis]|nr:Eukaryotic translation initiation factor 3 110 kDa subunit [Burkholderia vietnamiensis]